MKTLIAAAVVAFLVGLVAAPSAASAQSRPWLMKQGVFCPDGRRAWNTEICQRRALRAAQRKKAAGRAL
jgi:hypothetical protein